MCHGRYGNHLLPLPSCRSVCLHTTRTTTSPPSPIMSNSLSWVHVRSGPFVDHSAQPALLLSLLPQVSSVMDIWNQLFEDVGDGIDDGGDVVYDTNMNMSSSHLPRDLSGDLKTLPSKAFEPWTLITIRITGHESMLRAREATRSEKKVSNNQGGRDVRQSNCVSAPSEVTSEPQHSNGMFLESRVERSNEIKCYGETKHIYEVTNSWRYVR
ncbi:hypothetical protein ACFE04_020414 [Oxalis oulophora]